MTPRSLIFMKAFWFYGRFLRQCHFQNLLLPSQKSQLWLSRKISFVWLPRVKCLFLLCKTKRAWIKRSIHYVTLQCYTFGGAATHRYSSVPQSWFLIQKKQIVKMTLPEKNGSRIKTLSSKSLILVLFCWKKNFLHINALTNFFKISDHRCCVLPGPPCVINSNWLYIVIYYYFLLSLVHIYPSIFQRIPLQWFKMTLSMTYFGQLPPRHVTWAFVETQSLFYEMLGRHFVV